TERSRGGGSEGLSTLVEHVNYAQNTGSLVCSVCFRSYSGTVTADIFTLTTASLLYNTRVNLYPIVTNSRRRCLVAILLLMGGVEANPGPQPRRINMGMINAFSIVKRQLYYMTS